MNNQCRSCGSAIYNTKGRNLFQRQNAELLSNIDLVTGSHSVHASSRIKRTFCNVARDLEIPSALDEELKGRFDFDEPDAHETAQVADLLITSLQKDLAYGNQSSDTENINESPKRLSKKSTTKSKSNRSTPLTSINVDQLTNSNPLPVANNKPFECEFCGKDFKNPSKLTRHLPAHTGERAFKCQYCDRSFTTRGNNIRHERTHTREGAFPCATCGMSFSHAFVLKKHINMNHTETSAYL
ncbi:histone-lysine N-methyltransferase PRDM9-like [Drosophila obscura]|uniref:histone-lysine N-methyltransferase PRDM9-like n=1 Tax=Drosophila obscura TaxID=7282 RepID=UPI001BB1C73E|nr:histone-lysine N-methyltransferase PRDM9-like [Drosophila obscura]